MFTGYDNAKEVFHMRSHTSYLYLDPGRLALFTNAHISLPMLSSLIRLPVPSEPATIEDIFSSAIGLIFTDDLHNQHGYPGSSVIYQSKAFGDLELRLVDPNGEDARKLFAQYLWNAGIFMAELLGGGTQDGGAMMARGGSWAVKGEKVLELGAGG